MFYKVLFVDTGDLVGETEQHRPKGAATSGGPQKPARTGGTVMALTWHGSYFLCFFEALFSRFYKMKTKT